MKLMRPYMQDATKYVTESPLALRTPLLELEVPIDLPVDVYCKMESLQNTGAHVRLWSGRTVFPLLRHYPFIT